MKRVLAVAVAAFLVSVAILVRAAIDDGGDGDDGSGDGDGDGALVVACVPELRDACERLDAEVRVEDPASTIEAADDIDAWVTFDPWPAMAAEVLDRDPFDGELVSVASSALVLVARTPTTATCGQDEPNWSCVTGGRAALPSPDSALGALLLGHAALGWNAVVRPGEPFASNEFALPEFTSWRQAIDLGGNPVLDMLQLGAAGPGATGTTRATFNTVVQPSPRAEGLEAFATDSPATVAVVVVGRAAERVAGDDDLVDGLDDLGFDVGDDAAPATTGLPRPGVLLALQELT